MRLIKHLLASMLFGLLLVLGISLSLGGFYVLFEYIIPAIAVMIGTSAGKAWLLVCGAVVFIIGSIIGWAVTK